MQYRKFGKSDFMVSDFGMGNMRLPTKKNENGDNVIDRDEAIKMIRYAIDHGVNYLDTAYVYHNQESEVVVGLALKDGYRERAKVATKLPMHQFNTREEMDTLLATSLERLGVDTIDYYLLHSLNKNTWKKGLDLGVLEFLDAAKADGRIAHACFSFHDDYDTFIEIVDAYDWDMCQLQINYLDIENQAGVKGMQYAAAKGIAVVIMEPLRGGRLVNVPEDVQAIFDSYPVKYSPVEWAFRWLYNQPEVTTILSGVSTMEQLQDNLRIFENSGAGKLSAQEVEIVLKAKEAYEKRIAIPCTACGYCLPCPNGVAIPDVFASYNEGYMYNDFKGIARRYKQMIAKECDASKCIGCGACEVQCPQSIAIIEQMEMIAASELAQ